MSPSRVVWTRPAAFATPKSSTRATPSVPTRTFCGDMSRWTRPSGCASLVDRLVRGMQTVERAGHDRHDDAGRQAIAAIARAPDEARERLAADVLHDEQELVVVHDDVEGRDDVRVLDARGEPRLVEEHRGEVRVVRELRVQALDGDRTEEPRGADQAPEVDRRHATGRDRVVDGVTVDE